MTATDFGDDARLAYTWHSNDSQGSVGRGAEKALSDLSQLAIPSDQPLSADDGTVVGVWIVARHHSILSICEQ